MREQENKKKTATLVKYAINTQTILECCEVSTGRWQESTLLAIGTKMKGSLTILAILVPLAYGENVTEQRSVLCSQQIEAWQMCQLKELPRSSEGKLLKEKIDNVYEKCSGTMPKNCTIFWKTADECFYRELDKVDAQNSSRRQALQAIDQCYQRSPNDPFADLFESLYPEMLLFDDGGLKSQKQLTFAERKFLPPLQCAPTLDNLHCVSKEMALLAGDAETMKAADTLRLLNRGCNDRLTPQCTPHSPPLLLCVDRALKQLTRLTEDSMQNCMQQKGFVIVPRQLPAAGGSMFGFPGWSGQQQGSQPMTAPAAGAFGWGNTPFAPNGAFQGQPRAFDWAYD